MKKRLKKKDRPSVAGLKKVKNKKAKSLKKVSKKHKTKPFDKKKFKKKAKAKQKVEEKKSAKDFPTLLLKTEHDIAMDFAVKAYKKFDKIIKSVVLFGSQVKESAVAGSDIDIIIIIDDVAIHWDQELIAWYREELEKLLKRNPYKQSLHINTIKLSTWWEDLIRGDPVVINVLRHGETMMDMAGFFKPLKYLLLQGKIKPSPEAIYVSLQRAPMHLQRSKASELSAIEGLYWAMVDSAHAALISINVLPPSPEHLAADLKQHFVAKSMLKMKYVEWYRDLLMLHKKITHNQIKDLRGVEIDAWQEKTSEFIEVMAKLVKTIVGD
jgi:predicted nucleotidyltransferase